MEKYFLRIGFILYIVFVIFINFYILSYNFFEVANFGKYTFFSSSKIKDYQRGYFIISSKNNKDVNVGDTIYFYNSYEAKSEILSSVVFEISKNNENEITYQIENNKLLSSSYLIGKEDDFTKVPFIGYTVDFVTSTIGYFLTIFIPLLWLFGCRVLKICTNSKVFKNVV